MTDGGDLVCRGCFLIPCFLQPYISISRLGFYPTLLRYTCRVRRLACVFVFYPYGCRCAFSIW